MRCKKVGRLHYRIRECHAHQTSPTSKARYTIIMPRTKICGKTFIIDYSLRFSPFTKFLATPPNVEGKESNPSTPHPGY